MLLVSGWASAQSQVREVFMCKDATLRIRAESAGAVRYEWFLDNQVITGTSSDELLVKNEGTYKAVGVNADGCESGSRFTSWSNITNLRQSMILRWEK